MSDNLDKILKRIQDLKKHAESAESIGNIAEAAAFTSKVNSLLLQYNLELSEVDNFQTKPEVEKDEDVDVKKSNGKWMTSLINVLCQYNCCQAIQTENKSTKLYYISIIGKKENIEVVKFLYSVLKRRFEDIALLEFKKYIDDVRKQSEISHRDITKYNVPLSEFKKTKTGYQLKKPHKFLKGCLSRSQFNKSFFIGAVRGVKLKLEADKAAALSSEIGQKITSLVKLHDTAITDFLNREYQDLRTAKTRAKRIDKEIYDKGVEVGRNSNIAKGVANGDSVPTQMLK